jgi:PTH1 family peptidyl-tRNA hydrolase
MNLSGKSIREVVDFYKIELENIIVIYDDLDIEAGVIKIRKKGGAGTHNGMKSVVSELNTQEFIRVRIGIGKPNKEIDLANYVLEKVQKKDYEVLQSGILNASKAVETIIDIGVDNAMNKYN